MLALTKDVGVNIVVDFSNLTPFLSETLELTAYMLPVTVGQSYWEKNIASLARDGRMVMLGLMSGAVTEKPFNLAPILFKRLRIEGMRLTWMNLSFLN